MNKRLIIALALTILVFVGYTVIKKYVLDDGTKPKTEVTEKVAETEETPSDIEGEISTEEETPEESIISTIEEEETTISEMDEEEEYEGEPLIIEPILSSKGEKTTVSTPLYELTMQGGEVTEVKWTKYPTNEDVPLFTGEDIDTLPLHIKFKSDILNKTVMEHPYQTTIESVKLPHDGNTKEVIFFSESNDGRIEKHLKFHHNRYVVDLEIVAKGDKFITELAKGYSISPGSFTADKEKDWNTGDTKTITLVNDDKKDDKFDKKTEEKTYKGLISWCAIDSKYFISALVPVETESSEVRVSREKKEHLEISLITDKTTSFIYYLGPKENDRLKKVGYKLDKSISFGWSILAPIAKLFLWVLNFFHGITGNYGVDIIILSVLLNLILLPLSLKGFRSSRIMSELQPKLKELQKQYKDDPQELNKQTFALYKEYGASPFGGCLPMLLQMPIFISLYWMLRSAVELKGAHFFLWITDLSAQDALFKLPFTIPLIGSDNFNLLPLLMIIAMFISQKISVSTPIASAQSKFMAFMPIIFGFIFYSFPSGLVLYWLINTVLNTIQQKYLVKSVINEPEGGKK